MTIMVYTLGAISLGILTNIIFTIMKLNLAAQNAATVILGSLPLFFRDSSTLYCISTLYKHNTLPAFYWMNQYEWYYDSDFEHETGTIDDVYAARV